jgi:hypothetical protein
VGFQHRTEAERFLKEFRERLAKFGLELHPDKTRLIEFGRFAARDQFLLGHVSVQTTERYLGCKQRFRNAVNDRIGLEPDPLGTQ